MTNEEMKCARHCFNAQTPNDCWVFCPFDDPVSISGKDGSYCKESDKERDHKGKHEREEK